MCEHRKQKCSFLLQLLLFIAGIKFGTSGSQVEVDLLNERLGGISFIFVLIVPAAGFT